MTTRTVSDFTIASWIARLAIAIALAIGIIFAALVANAEPPTTMHENGLAVAAQIAPR